MNATEYRNIMDLCGDARLMPEDEDLLSRIIAMWKYAPLPDFESAKIGMIRARLARQSRCAKW